VRFVFVMTYTLSHYSSALNVVLSLSRAGALRPGLSEVLMYTQLPAGMKNGGPLVHGGQKIAGAFVLQSEVPDATASFGTSGFSQIVRSKFTALRDAMRRHPDAHIVWLDTDLYFFSDPREGLVAHAAAHPAAIAHFQGANPGRVCTGFFMVCPQHIAAARTMLLNPAEAMLREHLTGAGGNAKEYADDESCMNRVIQRRGPAACSKLVSVLPAAVFPNGRDYFDRNRRSGALMVHNNWISGLERKIARFRQHGLWNLSPHSLPPMA
jgi:hypothetical protein